MLAIIIHNVSNPQAHYIKKVDVSLNGKEILGLADFYRKLWTLGKAGVEVPLGILRGMQIRDFKVLSGDRYQFLLLKPKKI